MGKIIHNGQVYGGGSGGSSELAELDDVDVLGVVDGDALVYDDATSKWVPGTAGAVDDVEVNGTSVVDANKIAQIVSYKELTRAEYDALPDTKLTDGIMYCIKDGFNNPNGFPPLIYSTEEREVGVWIDGKPLYQKNITFTSVTISSANTWYTVADVSDLGIDILTDSFLRSTTANYTTRAYISKVDDGNFKIFSLTSAGWLCDSAVLWYTKTTDTAGSGKWATDGGLAKHYSTTEQIIGTWIDGKPLYEKVLIPTGLTTDTEDEDFAISNVDEIISCDGRISNTSNTLCTTTPFVVNNEYRCGFQASVLNSTTVRCRSYYGSQSSSYRIKAIILKYTKTTD